MFFSRQAKKAGGGNLLRRIFWKCFSQTILYQIGGFGTRIQTAMYGMHSTRKGKPRECEMRQRKKSKNSKYSK